MLYRLRTVTIVIYAYRTSNNAKKQTEMYYLKTNSVKQRGSSTGRFKNTILGHYGVPANRLPLVLSHNL